MDYPVLVKTGKRLANPEHIPEENPMKKKRVPPGRKSGKRPMGSGKPLFLQPKERAPAGSAIAGRPALRGVHLPAAALTIRRLEHRLAEAEARIAELRASAETDFLLDILNRRGFERELNRAIAYIARYRASGALIVLDVDRLKPINDAFGHAAGDAVLKAVVGVLRRHVRASDVIGRLGGDEFVLLLWNLGEADAQIKAAALEAAIDQLTFVFRESRVSAGASAGVALLGPGVDATVALAQADRAMYARKKERRGPE
ncbi:GGDEF domain-containing protein [Rhodopseudomonas sp. P2A-2r]|uniref:GGDEF domain-containing protein n=1 Tax=Rhodopseudomonas sp. P2A-2r TaxID=2991972 RepID=UPI002234BE86|nr:GGDEF domain-containing protein [Rhodopseudomonas sp. P2A-2r]UZE50419.1 GGDEF domain-containing protein [Rhodopseudomonas sp. P2A-2r]